MYVYIYIYIYIHTYVYIYVYVCVYICIYIYIYMIHTRVPSNKHHNVSSVKRRQTSPKAEAIVQQSHAPTASASVSSLTGDRGTEHGGILVVDERSRHWWGRCKSISFWQIGKKVRPGTFGNIKVGSREYPKRPSVKRHELRSDPSSAEPISADPVFRSMEASFVTSRPSESQKVMDVRKSWMSRAKLPMLRLSRNVTTLNHNTLIDKAAYAVLRWLSQPRLVRNVEASFATR